MVVLANATNSKTEPMQKICSWQISLSPGWDFNRADQTVLHPHLQPSLPVIVKFFRAIDLQSNQRLYRLDAQLH